MTMTQGMKGIEGGAFFFPSFPGEEEWVKG
jgi:hypothetical protein